MSTGNDMLQWADIAPGGGSVGEPPGGDLVALAQVPLGAIPNPRSKKVRRRPNNGRKRRYIGPFLDEPPWDLLAETGYPIPGDLKMLGGVPPCWRRGAGYEIWRAQVREMWGTVCHLCGHEEAHTADHLVPLSKWGNQPYDPRLSRPAHGVEGCPTCEVKCNSSRGNRLIANAIRDYKPPVTV